MKLVSALHVLTLLFASVAALDYNVTMSKTSFNVLDTKTLQGKRDWQMIVASSDGTKVMIATSKSSSQEIFRSIDRGTTWTTIRIPGRNNGFYNFVCSSDGNIVAALGYQKIYTSNDFGNTWVEGAQITSNYRFKGFAASADMSKLIVGPDLQPSATGDANMWRSADSGNTWIEIDNAGEGGASQNFQRITSSSDGAKIAALSDPQMKNNKVWYSLDSGVNWSSVSPGGKVNDITLSSDGATLWSCTSTKTYKSTDSAATWTKVLDKGGTHIKMSGNGATVILSDDSADTYMYISTDSGNTWNNVTSAGGKKKWSQAAILSDASTIWSLSDYVWKSSDMGSSWNKLSIPLSAKMDWKRITSSGDGSKLAIAYNGWSKYSNIYVSNDSGQNWVEATTLPIDEKIGSLKFTKDGSRLLAGVGGEVYTSNNLGTSWTNIYVSTGSVKNIAVSSSGSIILVAIGTILSISDNSGQTWEDFTPYNRTSFDNMAMSDNGNNIFIGGAGSMQYNGHQWLEGIATVWRSGDSGNTWIEITPSANNSYDDWSSLTSSSDGTKVAVVGAKNRDYTIFLSKDSGETWTQVPAFRSKQTGFLDIISSANGMTLNAIDQYHIYNGNTPIAINGSIWKSIDGGETWVQKQCNNSLFHHVVSSSDGTKLALIGKEYFNDYSGNYVYTGTFEDNTCDSTTTNPSSETTETTIAPNNMPKTTTAPPKSIGANISGNAANIVLIVIITVGICCCIASIVYCQLGICICHIRAQPTAEESQIKTAKSNIEMERRYSNNPLRQVNLLAQAPKVGKASEKYRTMFKKIDTNKSNGIDIHEFKVFIHGTSKQQVMSNLHIEHIFNMIDSDKNKSLSYEEFVHLVSKLYRNLKIPLTPLI